MVDKLHHVQESENVVIPTENKRKIHFKKAKRHFLIAVGLFVVLTIMIVVDDVAAAPIFGPIIHMIPAVAFLVFLIIGIVNLIGWFIAKRS